MSKLVEIAEDLDDSFSRSSSSCSFTSVSSLSSEDDLPQIYKTLRITLYINATLVSVYTCTGNTKTRLDAISDVIKESGAPGRFSVTDRVNLADPVPFITNSPSRASVQHGLIHILSAWVTDDVA